MFKIIDETTSIPLYLPTKGAKLLTDADMNFTPLTSEDQEPRHHYLMKWNII
jgi:hypothetical protein